MVVKRGDGIRVREDIVSKGESNWRGMWSNQGIIGFI
jgi:hypothetical protein